MERKTLRLLILKNLLYSLLILLAFLLQDTPALFPNALRPVLVISAVCGIAMTEGEFYGGLFGLFGGLFCDTAVFHLFGVASLYFLILGCTCGLLIIYLIQPTLKSAFLLSGAFALIYGLSVHYLIYGMWGYDGSWQLIFTRTLPSACSTALFGIPCFWLTRHIHQFFAAAIKR